MNESYVTLNNGKGLLVLYDYSVLDDEFGASYLIDIDEVWLTTDDGDQVRHVLSDEEEQEAKEIIADKIDDTSMDGGYSYSDYME